MVAGSIPNLRSDSVEYNSSRVSEGPNELSLFGLTKDNPEQICDLRTGSIARVVKTDGAPDLPSNRYSARTVPEWSKAVGSIPRVRTH